MGTVVQGPPDAVDTYDGQHSMDEAAETSSYSGRASELDDHEAGVLGDDAPQNPEPMVGRKGPYPRRPPGRLSWASDTEQDSECKEFWTNSSTWVEGASSSSEGPFRMAGTKLKNLEHEVSWNDLMVMSSNLPLG